MPEKNVSFAVIVECSINISQAKWLLVMFGSSPSLLIFRRPTVSLLREECRGPQLLSQICLFHLLVLSGFSSCDSLSFLIWKMGMPHGVVVWPE